MKHATRTILLIIFTCVLTGCPSPPPTPTPAPKPNVSRSKYNPVLGKVVLNPNKGDVLQWDVDVTFPNYSNLNPCKNQVNHTKECTIDVETGRFSYECENCEDPEVEVGTETEPPVEATSLATTRAISKVAVYLACVDNNNLILNPNPRAAFAGQGVAWETEGTNPPSDWKVHVPNGCSNGMDFDHNNPICALNARAGAMVPYQAVSMMCGNAPKDGMINVK